MKINKSTSFYISIAGMDPGWIVGKISEDIKKELEIMGYKCNYGAPENYNNEEVCYHMGWAYAKPQKNAKINSIFITHIDDSLKESLLISMKNKFDSFICMSEEYENFLLELGFDKAKVFGLTLPTRNQYVKPMSIGIFSSYYDDNRKNEKWLLKFCKSNEDVININFVFIGPEWGNYVMELDKYNCSFEWHNTSRKMPYEYHFQQNKLSNLDYYFYLGFDGGAMGTYDAYAYGNRLLISDQCYHKSIPDVEHYFTNYKEFENELLKIIKFQKTKLQFFNENTPKKYVFKLWQIWNDKEKFKNKQKSNIYENTKISKRSKYHSISLRRFLGALKRYIYSKI
jgi:hypothetical protein